MTAHRGKFVAYYRVSTDKQGKSGLGLDAQRKAVVDYLNGGTWELAAEFTEIELGKKLSGGFNWPGHLPQRSAARPRW